MGVPTAPKEGGGTGEKILFLTFDDEGINAPAILRAYKSATLNTTDVADMGVYPTSGTLENGSKVLSGATAECIVGATLPCQGALLKAYSDNVGTVYVGKSDVTADKTAGTGGYPLDPGDTVGVPCRDALEVYIRGTSGDGVAFIASAD